MMYKSSKGEVEIATMPLRYAANALNKLQRDEPHRAAEIEALEAHVASLDQDGEPSNPRAVIGDNNPPEEIPVVTLTGRDAIDTHVADLMIEAANWGDGVAVLTQEQADAVGRLHRMLQQAVDLVDKQADKEKRPLNDAVNEIATWQNGYTAKKLKTKPDGKLTKAIAVTGNLAAAWLRKLEDERIERERIAADKARESAREAISLHEEAKDTTDLNVIDRAEDALSEAKALLRQAEGVSKEKVRVGGGDGLRAMSLRSVWSARPTGEPGCWGLAYAHYKTNAEFMAEFHALIQRWADRDCRIEATRLLGVPGFNFIEEKVV